METYNEQGLVLLRIAIVKQAIKDYKRAYLSFVRTGTENNIMSECERFFNDSWYETLCDIDGKKLIKMIKISVLDKQIEIHEKSLGNKKTTPFSIAQLENSLAKLKKMKQEVEQDG